MASLIKILLNKDWAAAYSRIDEIPQDLKVQYPIDAPLNATALEAAIQAGASDDLILKILDAYPKQAMVENSYTGYTPLFTACSYGASEKVISALIMAYPQMLLEKRRCRFKKGTPRKVVKWSSWKYCQEQKEKAKHLLSQTPEYWEAHAARAIRMRRGSSLSKNTITPGQATRGFADVLGEVQNEEVDVDDMEETLKPAVVEESDDEEEEEEEDPPTVVQVLEELQIPYLAERFEQEVILTFDDLKDLSVDDLKEMKLKIGERNRLKKYIARANEPKVDPSKDPEIVAMKHYASLFHSIDENGQGGIDLVEFTGALKALGKYRNEFDTKVIFEKADINGDGEIDLDEFIALMKLAKKAEGERSAILKGLAESHDEASDLGRIAAACQKHNIRMKDIFETPESPTAMDDAAKALSMAESGSADKCRDADINSTIDFLILDTSFTLKAAEATCTLEVGRQIKMLTEKAASMKEKAKVAESDINLDDVVQNAVQIYRDACYAHSSLPENRSPQGRGWTELEQADLNEFRLCALQASCSKAVSEFPPIKAESQRLLITQGTQLAIKYGPQLFTMACQAL